MKLTRRHIALGLALFLLRGNCLADWLSDLQSPEVTTRRATIDAIQTLEDPRIPAACLPLLQDEGFSIRRQAARAIGSRFAQIPASRKEEYLKALKKCEAEGPADVSLICQRAIGLLTQTYSYPSFSVSPNGAWVLYERRRLPVIANVQTRQHMLLAPVDLETDPDQALLLKLAVTCDSAMNLFDPHWHPQGNVLVFTPHGQWRFYHPICVWVAGEDAVKVLDVEFFKPLLGSRYPTWGTTTDFVRWDGNKVVVRIYDCASPDGPPPHDPGVLVSYDIRTGKIASEIR
jgi:hypothetical protein